MNKIAFRAIIRKKIFTGKWPSLDQFPDFQNNFTEMFLLGTFTKIAKMVPIQWTS